MSHVLTSRDMDRTRTIAHGFARGVGMDGQDAESVAMEALARAYLAWDGRGSWPAYSGQRVRFALIDEARKTRPVPVDIESLPDHTEVLNAPTTDPDALLAQVILHEALRDLRVEFLLEGIDRRRFAHRSALVALRRRLA